MDKTAERKSQTEETLVKPVRSAKDAINAMYAQDPEKRLSSYLASSAQEIINASGRGSAKSAANLHRGSIQHQMEAAKNEEADVRVASTRLSASGMIKTAKPVAKPKPKDPVDSMDPLARKANPTPVVRKRPTRVVQQDISPVVKTSLKLAPRRRNVSATSAARTPRPQMMGNGTLNAPKGQTALSKLLSSRRKNTVAAGTAAHSKTTTEDPVHIMQQAARQALGRPEPVSVQRSAQPKRRTRRGLMQDVVRPGQQMVNRVASPKTTNMTEDFPADSVRNRFQTAPKDYVAEATVQEDSYVGYGEDFEPAEYAKPPVDIYGMMDEEPTGNVENLGVVEDYRPQGDTLSEGINEQKVAQGSGKASPDNHKYALGGQSPFFLKTVNVEKRPLSDGPTRGIEANAGTLYERPSTEPVSKKNVYAKKETTEPKKALPTKTTVIIPASRRSKAPLICLLLLTVILGAAVGAFIYLCFFQYLE